MKIFTVITKHIGSKGVHIMNFETVEKAKEFINSCSQSQCAILNIPETSIQEYSNIEPYYLNDDNLEDFWTCGKIIYGTYVDIPEMKVGLRKEARTRSYRFVYENEVY